jgi:predicted PurR-regulated permease PerM
VLVLLSIAGGGALFGIAGSLLAVPVTAVVVNAISEARRGPAELLPEPAPGSVPSADG